MASQSYLQQGFIIQDSTVVSGPTAASLVLFGGLSIAATTASNGVTSGALVIAGSLGLGGSLYATTSVFSGVQSITDSTNSSGPTSGSFYTLGGIGVLKDLSVGGNTTITGNLTVNGTTTSIISTTVSIADNTFQINAGPSGTRDAGFIISRYQVDNDAGTGDVVTDTSATSGTFGTGNSAGSVVLPAGFSAVTDAYKYWWLKVTSGTDNNQVRQITAYNGTTKVATLSSVLTAAPSDGVDTFSLYNKSYFASYFDTATNEYILGYTSNNTDITSDIYNAGYANIRSLGLYATNATVSNIVATAISSGSISFTSAIVSNLNVTNTGTIANAFLPVATIGSLVVNGVSANPSAGDIITEGSFSAANNQSSSANVTGLAFANGTVRSFVANVSVTILTTADADNRYANFTLTGVHGLSGWVYNSKFVGDNSRVIFTINSSGQVQYTSSNITDFISNTIKFRAETTTV